MLKEQLGHAQKLTALGELASTTTHEFNNVLTTIINYAKLGLRHKDNQTREKAFDKILLASNRAAKITSTVLGLARNRKAGQEPTNLTELVENTLLLLEREMNKYRITVDKSLQPMPEAYVNGNQIQQMLLNLLINARQAMPSGGRVTIRLAYDAESEMIDLVVRDNGTGIPADKLPRIFEPFYTTKSGPDSSGKGGTGLGLLLCREIIEAHNGRIRVESTVGKGTSFTLKLPTVAKAQAERPVVAPPILPIDAQSSVAAPAGFQRLMKRLGQFTGTGVPLRREAVENLSDHPLLGGSVMALRNPILVERRAVWLQAEVQRGVGAESGRARGGEFRLLHVFQLLIHRHVDPKAAVLRRNNFHHCMPTDRLQRAFQPLVLVRRVVVPRLQQGSTGHGESVDPAAQDAVADRTQRVLMFDAEVVRDDVPYALPDHFVIGDRNHHRIVVGDGHGLIRRARCGDAAEEQDQQTAAASLYIFRFANNK